MVHAPPQQTSTRYLSLDFWRGLACLMVVTGHAISRMTPGSGGLPAAGEWWEQVAIWMSQRMWIGVPIFFVISGYCISASADSTRRLGRPISEYFLRRFRRIFPPYWICVAVSCVLVACGNFLAPNLFTDISLPWKIPALHWIGNLTLTETWLGQVFNYPFAWSNLFICPAWTLCYEEQFYAVVGILIWLAGPRYYAAIAAVTAAVLWRSVASPASYNSGFFFDGRWLSFAAGVAVYYDLQHAKRLQSWLLRGLLVAGIAWSCHDPAILKAPSSIELDRLCVFTFALLLIVLHRWDARLHHARLLRPITLCGTMCYSIYLMHWVVVRPISHGLGLLGLSTVAETLLVVVPLSLATCVGVGALFHVLVERRFLNSPLPATGGPLRTGVAATPAAPLPAVEVTTSGVHPDRHAA